MPSERVIEFLLQALETEFGCITVCATATDCTDDPGLRREWEMAHQEARSRAAALAHICSALQIDSRSDTVGRSIVRDLARSLERAMRIAKESGDGHAARLVAAECVLLARMKVRQNWEVIGDLASSMAAADGGLLREAHAHVERQQEGHLYHTRARRLWGEALGVSRSLVGVAAPVGAR